MSRQPSADTVASRMGNPQGVDSAAVRDTIARIFGQADYDRSLRDTLLSRAWSWGSEMLRSLMRSAGEAPRPVYWGAVVLLVALAALVAARVAYGVYQRREREGGRARGARREGGAPGRDAWLLAQQLAGAGDYTGAAHALYAALLQALAARERLRLHPSKTTGDYGRELRARSSALLGRYRDFARSYEAVVYGGLACDRARFERLRHLAAPLLGRDA